jgi:pimeloyl-ACP methyl ester carboxylesterase
VLATVKSLIRDGTAEGVAAAQRRMAKRPDSVPTLSRITCPTLMVYGEEGQLIPFAEAQRIGRTSRAHAWCASPARATSSISRMHRR